MLTFSSFIKAIENIPGEIAHLFTAHQAQIHTVLADAQVAVSGAAAVAGVLEPSAIPMLTLVQDGLTKISAAATAEANATTLSSQAATLGGLVSSLVTSGDVGVKNANTKAAIQNAVTKSQAVVGALLTASIAASAAAPPAAPSN